jgi:hypothetical protein
MKSIPAAPWRVLFRRIYRKEIGGYNNIVDFAKNLFCSPVKIHSPTPRRALFLPAPQMASAQAIPFGNIICSSC